MGNNCHRASLCAPGRESRMLAPSYSSGDLDGQGTHLAHPGLHPVADAGGAGGAQAQSYGYGYDDDRYGVRDGSGIVRCESVKNRSNECRLDGRARLIRQLSGSPCVEGETWGQSRNGVWVTQGAVPNSSVNTPRRRLGRQWRRLGQRQWQRMGRWRCGYLPFQWPPAGVLRCPHPPGRAPDPPGLAQCLHRRPELGLGSPRHLGERWLQGAVPGELSFTDSTHENQNNLIQLTF